MEKIAKFQYTCVSPKSSKELEHIIENERVIAYSTLINHFDK